MKECLWTPERIKALRAAFDEPQYDFALRLGVRPETIAVWEQGRGEPGGSAQLLLDRIERDDLPRHKKAAGTRARK